MKRVKLLKTLIVAFLFAALALILFGYIVGAYIAVILAGCGISELPNDPETDKWNILLSRKKRV